MCKEGKDVNPAVSVQSVRPKLPVKSRTRNLRPPLRPKWRIDLHSVEDAKNAFGFLGRFWWCGAVCSAEGRFFDLVGEVGDPRMGDDGSDDDEDADAGRGGDGGCAVGAVMRVVVFRAGDAAPAIPPRTWTFGGLDLHRRTYKTLGQCSVMAFSVKGYVKEKLKSIHLHFPPSRQYRFQVIWQLAAKEKKLTAS